MSDFCPHGIVENHKNCPSCMETMAEVKDYLANKPCVCPQPPYDVKDARLYSGVECPKHGLFKL